MIELDGDEERISSQGRYAERDIVQVRPRLSECPLSRMSGGMLGLVINEGTMTPADPSLGVPTLVFFFLFFPFIWFLFNLFHILFSSFLHCRYLARMSLLVSFPIRGCPITQSIHIRSSFSFLFVSPPFYLSFFNSLTHPFVPCHRSFHILENEFLHDFAIFGLKYGIKKKECTGKGELCIHRSPVCRSAMLAFG